MFFWCCSEHDEGLSDVALHKLLLDSEHVEPDSLAEWSALTYGDDIADLCSSEGWAQVCWQVVMSLLKSVILFDVMQVISSQNHCSLHLVRQHDTLEDSSSDTHVRGEWTLLINVFTSLGIKWSLETETNLLRESLNLDFLSVLSNLLGKSFLGVVENANLLLISFLSLNIGHCDCCNRLV